MRIWFVWSGAADADGIIQYGYIGCSLGGIMTELQRDHFKKMGIPFLSLEGSFQVGEASGRVETRVKAFIEMLSWGERRWHITE